LNLEAGTHGPMQKLSKPTPIMTSPTKIAKPKLFIF